MNTNDFVDRQDLIDRVLHQIGLDVENQDFSAIEELIKLLPDKKLINYLPEEQQ